MSGLKRSAFSGKFVKPEGAKKSKLYEYDISLVNDPQDYRYTPTNFTVETQISNNSIIRQVTSRKGKRTFDPQLNTDATLTIEIKDFQNSTNLGTKQLAATCSSDGFDARLFQTTKEAYLPIMMTTVTDKSEQGRLFLVLVPYSYFDYMLFGEDFTATGKDAFPTQRLDTLSILPVKIQREVALPSFLGKSFAELFLTKYRTYWNGHNTEASELVLPETVWIPGVSLTDEAWSYYRRMIQDNKWGFRDTTGGTPTFEKHMHERVSRLRLMGILSGNKPIIEIGSKIGADIENLGLTLEEMIYLASSLTNGRYINTYNEPPNRDDNFSFDEGILQVDLTVDKGTVQPSLIFPAFWLPGNYQSTNALVTGRLFDSLPSRRLRLFWNLYKMPPSNEYWATPIFGNNKYDQVEHNYYPPFITQVVQNDTFIVPDNRPYLDFDPRNLAVWKTGLPEPAKLVVNTQYQDLRFPLFWDSFFRAWLAIKIFRSNPLTPAESSDYFVWASKVAFQRIEIFTKVRRLLDHAIIGTADSSKPCDSESLPEIINAIAMDLFNSIYITISGASTSQLNDQPNSFTETFYGKLCTKGRLVFYPKNSKAVINRISGDTSNLTFQVYIQDERGLEPPFDLSSYSTLQIHLCCYGESFATGNYLSLFSSVAICSVLSLKAPCQ